VQGPEGACKLDTKRYEWFQMAAWDWAREQHINVLELQAVFQAYRALARDPRRHNHRTLHGIDNMVAFHVLNKGRSSSWRLNMVMRRLSAIVLATNSYIGPFYVPTKLNPADFPSRPDLTSEQDRFKRSRRAPKW
jgi:hypothetical protein